MSLYKSLLRRKENGEILDFETLTHEELKTLVGQRCIDAELADLYNLPKSYIKKRRKERGVDAIEVDSEITASILMDVIRSHTEEVTKEATKGMCRVSDDELKLLGALRLLHFTTDTVFSALYGSEELSDKQRVVLLAIWKDDPVSREGVTNNGSV